MKIYFANALFSQAELNYNAQLAAKIRQLDQTIDLYLPQENDSINDKQAYADSKMIAQADTEKLLASDLMVAVLDGLSIDNGVASEIGVAYAKEIPIIGLYTDTRQQGSSNQQKLQALGQIAENQFHYVNLYTTGLIKLNGTIVNNEADLLEAVKKYL
ncbi:nucleoside 2-deoxyribosyltransferase [Lactobacillus sp. M0403]|uniref:nucleoside 2-deoxyribosyltransferase n=1 Tax=Lactobacillus TaxID=1578 RepID=UPI00164EF4B0|nr:MULTISPECIES: nucleoside 2-deoxyribosyltransferase [Lactobacillus]MBC6361843.1 nucleoside 2-deoxyribosyltransferase [Lactobacillus apis]MBH9986305.1 nucleoside 2-deoxyribosyltransferase [Lactobacillus sp. M0390]MBI0093583.1 nucleoside 2-deoxyribosyltransferase [Lactobacillus sp. M0403]MCT6877116.1 nucleoside 2-deoxyribosyltransferase [Lactobacillus apis]